MNQSRVSHTLDDWLAVSTEGFAAMNAGREPAHLVKELVQNALDALPDRGGAIELTMQPADPPNKLLICCRDDGCGMKNLADIRTVFYTSKTDSHLKRGRMGRGFKEMLCLADSAAVVSGRQRLEFVTEEGRRVTRHLHLGPRQGVKGALVQMLMPWAPALIADLEAYFQRLLVPQGVKFRVNGQVIAPREVAHQVQATLATELFDNGRWIRPARSTCIELVRTLGQEEPALYELGIPVCPVGWDLPYHANVKQRAPMNPCRDAVASGYLLRLHRWCLPVLLGEMDSGQVRADWVGQAVGLCDEPTQKQVIRSGFGENLARSVPAMGVRQFDEDAREIGAAVIDTRQTSGGFRQILQQHVPTTRQVVNEHEQTLLSAAAAGSFGVGEVYLTGDSSSLRRRKLIEAVGGKQRVEMVMDFSRWFCNRLLDGYHDSAVCSVKLALLGPVGAIATWSNQDVLTLGIDTPWLWTDPLAEKTLSVLIHESAHHLNAHHGRDFHQEVENLAGRAARLMLIDGPHVGRTFGALLAPAPSCCGG